MDLPAAETAVDQTGAGPRNQKALYILGKFFYLQCIMPICLVCF